MANITQQIKYLYNKVKCLVVDVFNLQEADAPPLQEVTDIGNSTTNPIVLQNENDVNEKAVLAYDSFFIQDATGVNVRSTSYVEDLYIINSKLTRVKAQEPASPITLLYPVVSGTFALTSDITPSLYLGLYISLGALQTAHPTALTGNYANVDTGVGSPTRRYLWDVDDTQWVLGEGEHVVNTSELVNDGADGVHPFIDNFKLSTTDSPLGDNGHNVVEQYADQLSVYEEELDLQYNATDNTTTLSIAQNFKNTIPSEVAKTSDIINDGADGTSTYVETDELVATTAFKETPPEVPNGIITVFTTVNEAIGADYMWVYMNGVSRTDFTYNPATKEVTMGFAPTTGTTVVIQYFVTANLLNSGELNTIDSEPIGNESQVLQVVSISQANYDLITPVATTFYIIT